MLVAGHDYGIGELNGQFEHAIVVGIIRHDIESHPWSDDTVARALDAPTGFLELLGGLCEFVPKYAERFVDDFGRREKVKFPLQPHLEELKRLAAVEERADEDVAVGNDLHLATSLFGSVFLDRAMYALFDLLVSQVPTAVFGLALQTLETPARELPLQGLRGELINRLTGLLGFLGGPFEQLR
jgi:hypothetical protein